MSVFLLLNVGFKRKADDNMLDKQHFENKYDCPAIALRGMVLFPYTGTHLDVGRASSIKAIEYAMEHDTEIFLVTQIDPAVESPSSDDLYEYGTLARVKQLLKTPDNSVRVVVEGVCRGKIIKINELSPFIKCDVSAINEEDENRDEDLDRALIRKLRDACEDYFIREKKLKGDSVATLFDIKDVSNLADVVVFNMDLDYDEKQEFLETVDIFDRVTNLIAALVNEVEILHLENHISDRVEEAIAKNQKEYFLREQLKIVTEELEEIEGTGNEIDRMIEAVKTLKLEKESEEKLIGECEKLRKIPSHSADYSVIKNYLDFVCGLPWNTKTKNKFDIAKAKEILDRDHFGLKKVKETILEYLAVRKFAPKAKSTVLCLVGPPGVGKSSIAKSIAEALGRKYVRISLGGVRDEADIRGHRKTYIGAMPGRIISAVNSAKSNNPLILIDEIDKMSQSYNGDPSSAMLEVFDSEQNTAFRDHYTEVPFDISDVLFIATANSTETIAAPLLDRMDIIELTSYTEDEKLNIAKNHLIEKQKKAYGLTKLALEIEDSAVEEIIQYYTREAGVRNLERAIAKICRKAAKMILEDNRESVCVDGKNVSDFLGRRKFTLDKANKKDEIGIVRGLAWTAVGGDTLSVEVNTMPGTGKFEITGQIGDVMKESAKAAISYIRSKSDEFHINPDFYKLLDIHVHIPEGAVPKDGPSAGITMATAVISALTGRFAKASVAMTGEITLRGRVLPIGGLKEKTLAAYKAGIKTVIIPKENEPDLEDVCQIVKDNVKFAAVSTMDEVIDIALHKTSDKNFSLNLAKQPQGFPMGMPITAGESQSAARQ